MVTLPQWHFVGGAEHNPPRLGANHRARDALSPVLMIDDYDHKCCRAERWVTLWQEVR